jgi:hypothetical protein
VPCILLLYLEWTPVPLAARSNAARLLRSWVRIPPGAWMFVCCQVEVSATSWSLVQRSPTACGASLCVIKKSRERGGHSPRWAAQTIKKIKNNHQTNAHLIYSLLYFSIFVAPTCFNAKASSSSSPILCLLSYVNVLMQSWWCFVENLSHSVFRMWTLLNKTPSRLY